MFTLWNCHDSISCYEFLNASNFIKTHRFRFKCNRAILLDFPISLKRQGRNHVVFGKKRAVSPTFLASRFARRLFARMSAQATTPPRANNAAPTDIVAICLDSTLAARLLADSGGPTESLGGFRNERPFGGFDVSSPWNLRKIIS